MNFNCVLLVFWLKFPWPFAFVQMNGWKWHRVVALFRKKIILVINSNSHLSRCPSLPISADYFSFLYCNSWVLIWHSAARCTSMFAFIFIMHYHVQINILSIFIKWNRLLSLHLSGARISFFLWFFFFFFLCVIRNRAWNLPFSHISSSDQLLIYICIFLDAGKMNAVW